MGTNGTNEPDYLSREEERLYLAQLERLKAEE